LLDDFDYAEYNHNMDVKVYKKEEVLQPQGSEYVYVPNVIDIIPDIEVIDGVETITGCTTLEDTSRDLLEQQCALATIWQRGLDPLDLNDGIRWSEAILEELSCLQLIQDIIDAVASVTSAIKVVFDTVEDENGQQFLSYKLVEVA
jgi:hypothetical protein